jgi:hypothetical protein
MFQFTRLLQTSLCIQLAAVGNPGIITCLSTPPGFSQTSTPFILLTPRHPPCALSRLVIEIPNSEQRSQLGLKCPETKQTSLKPVQTSFIRKVIHLTISHDKLTFLRVARHKDETLQSANYKESYLEFIVKSFPSLILVSTEVKPPPRSDKCVDSLFELN